MFGLVAPFPLVFFVALIVIEAVYRQKQVTAGLAPPNYQQRDRLALWAMIAALVIAGVVIAGVILGSHHAVCDMPVTAAKLIWYGLPAVVFLLVATASYLYSMRRNMFGRLLMASLMALPVAATAFGLIFIISFGRCFTF